MTYRKLGLYLNCVSLWCLFNETQRRMLKFIIFISFVSNIIYDYAMWHIYSILTLSEINKTDEGE
jgi:hypothetical protein